MSRVTFDLPQHSLEALNVPTEKIEATLRMAAAVKLYEMERLSAGAAAELAGVPKPVFLERLADYGVDTFRLTEDEMLGEAPLG